MKKLYDIWKNSSPQSFCIDNENMVLKKNDLQKNIDEIEKRLVEIADWKGRLVFLDVKNRLLFISVFFALLKLDAVIVLVPTEIKPEDYIELKGLVLSDNKEHEAGLFINDNKFIKAGHNFDINQYQPEPFEECALFLYTSGSTGKAKLIPKYFKNIYCELNELKDVFKMNERDVLYFTPPLYHIYGLLFGLLLPLFSSAKIVLDYHFTPESIAEFVEEKKVTHFVSIPSYYKMFSHLGLISCFKKCCRLISSSAPLSIDISQKFYGEKLAIIEVYGSTETGGIAHRTSAVKLNWNLFSYVEIVKTWDDYLMGDKEVVEEVEFIIKSPAISVKHDTGRGFNTGDIVNIHPGSQFFLLGRNTRFVKISGKRVDLNYVLQKIKDYITTAGQMTVSEDDFFIGMYGEKIYVLYNKPFPGSSKIMKNELKDHLPGYAIPRIFISTEIPRNRMGKINKVAIEKMVENVLDVKN